MNYKFEQYEETINLKKLIIACMRQWRVMVIAAIVGALLLGAVDCVTQLTQTSVEDTEKETDAVTETEAITEEETTEEKSFSIGSVVTKSVVGAILGVILVCGYIFVKALIEISFGNALYSAEDLCQQLAIPVLASFYVPEGSKNVKNVTKIDKFIDKLEGVGNTIDEKNTYKVLAAKIDVMVPEKKTVLLIGSADEKAFGNVEKQLNQFNGKKYTVVTNLLQNPEGILKLKDSAVVLVVSETNAEKKNVMNQLEFLAQSNSDFVGAVIL